MLETNISVYSEVASKIKSGVRKMEAKRKRKYNHNRRLPKDYYNYFDLCKMEGIPENKAKNTVSKLGVEGIKSLDEFKPIESLFEVFEKPVKGRMLNSYGIRRRYYDEFKVTGECPKINKGRPKIKGISEMKVFIPTTLKEEVVRVRDKSNSMSYQKITLSDMTAVALAEYLERRPEFKELSQ